MFLYFFIRFAQPKITVLILERTISYLTLNIVLMTCVTVFYINDHASLLPNIFQIKTAEAHSEASEVELFAKIINSF